ncbi:hypothetical protein [Pseudomonas sp. p21]|uniref:hypothetical protein n=1 Tax=Pseudomonas sp. p21 TaxID=1825979 RepID=UPI0009EEA705|nr:hypothetical protein [Pseudomonas sp. p21]
MTDGSPKGRDVVARRWFGSPEEFKIEAVKQVTEEAKPVADVAQRLVMSVRAKEDQRLYDRHNKGDSNRQQEVSPAFETRHSTSSPNIYLPAMRHPKQEKTTCFFFVSFQ